MKGLKEESEASSAGAHSEMVHLAQDTAGGKFKPEAYTSYVAHSMKGLGVWIYHPRPILATDRRLGEEVPFLDGHLV